MKGMSMKQRFLTVAAVFFVALVWLMCVAAVHSPVIDGIIVGDEIFNSDLLTATGWIYSGGAIDIRGSKIATLIFDTTRLTTGTVTYGVYGSVDGSTFYRSNLIRKECAAGLKYVSAIAHTYSTPEFAVLDSPYNYIKIQASTGGSADGTFRTLMMTTQ